MVERVKLATHIVESSLTSRWFGTPQGCVTLNLKGNHQKSLDIRVFGDRAVSLTDCLEVSRHCHA